MSGPPQAQAAGEAPAPVAADAGLDPAALQQQLRAVQRELHTVSAAVDALQQHEQQQEQQEQQGQQGQQPAEQGQQDILEGGRAPLPASHAGNALQQAVMRQRLAGLQAQRQHLEDTLRGLGVEPAAEGSAGALPSGATGGQRKPSRGRTAFAAQGSSQAGGTAQPAARAAAMGEPGGTEAGGRARGRAGGKGRKTVQFAELEEADMFEEGGAAAGGSAGGPEGALVETERDRLIRLVGAAAGGMGAGVR